ncbi:trans-prenyltransferase [Tieghemostelium lacteum]|uniref:Trans-prenyltransferase n=1 Tax=Tieghemostelium lacteum TaxID=361077 RepID=A0A152A2D2_TIELA|nr:trans-prenyltransferase [Tieghemostelium lacteum]|eukprot:KYR00398.1 trans-prenyltransferase [Tieghemostelium lacteum]
MINRFLKNHLIRNNLLNSIHRIPDKFSSPQIIGRFYFSSISNPPIDASSNGTHNINSKTVNQSNKTDNSNSNQPFINRFLDKLKKKSFIIDQYIKFNFRNYKTLQETMDDIKLLDPLNNLTQVTQKDLFKSVESDLNRVTKNIISSLTIKSGRESNLFSFMAEEKTHPALSTLSSYYFGLKGKRIRPTLVILLAKAIEGKSQIQDRYITLAEVVEMIHTASLVHDDVIDEASTRRDVLSINHSFNNKLAILCGDYLLSRSCILLSSLRNHEVTESMSNSISELVEGEFIQARSKGQASFDNYLRKSYLKTASLLTNSCRSTALLSSCDSTVVDIATEFGKNIGLAFQIIDDLLDYTSSDEVAGKPTSVDLQLGLATAPVLYATQEYPQLENLITRKFSEPGDVEEAKNLVLKSKGIEKTRNLAIKYCNLAIENLLQLPQSESRDLLISISQTVVLRNK